MTTNSILDDQLFFSKLRNNQKRGKGLLILFYVHLVMAVINLGMTLRWHFLSDAQLHKEFFSSSSSSNDWYEYLQNYFALGYLTLHIASTIWFIVWFKGLYANLYNSRLKPLRFQRTMASISWFLPVIALYRPFLIMREIWTAMQTYLTKHLDGFRTKPFAILGVWWLFFNLSKITNRLSIYHIFHSEEVAAIKAHLIQFDIDSVIQLITVLVTIQLIKDTSNLELQFYICYN
ncbi:MAG: DUF4328 domain-containing protein [Bacteroidota bacterium]